jgi:hypothetical protein
MSAPNHPTSGSPAPQRHPGVTVLLVLAGIVLLLPGLCSIGFIVILSGEGLKDLFSDAGLVGLWAVCFAISAGGILLIRHAWKRRTAA